MAAFAKSAAFGTRVAPSSSRPSFAHSRPHTRVMAAQAGTQLSQDEVRQMGDIAIGNGVAMRAELGARLKERALLAIQQRASDPATAVSIALNELGA